MTKKFEFDGTKIEITETAVTVTELEIDLTLKPEHCKHLGMVGNAALWVDGYVRKKLCSRWTGERIVHCFSLAERWIAQDSLVAK